jgi:hypothetical protein
LINFLAKSGNSKHFLFFSIFSKKIYCGHYVCLPSTKIVVTMFACHLQNSSGMCLHLARTNFRNICWPEIAKNYHYQHNLNLKHPFYSGTESIRGTVRNTAGTASFGCDTAGTFTFSAAK